MSIRSRNRNIQKHTHLEATRGGDENAAAPSSESARAATPARRSIVLPFLRLLALGCLQQQVGLICVARTQGVENGYRFPHSFYFFWEQPRSECWSCTRRLRRREQIKFASWLRAWKQSKISVRHYLRTSSR